MQNTTTITPERDERNKRMIAMSIFNFMGFANTAEQYRLINEATPEERQAYVRKKTNRNFAIMGVVAVAFILWPYIPRDPVPPPPAPEISLAGQVQSIQLHETAFSRSSTVTTSVGTFQVRGGVSASVGDNVSLKKDVSYSKQYPKIELCVESKIKTQCYDVL